MPPILGSIVYIIGIYGLFLFDREPNAHTSKGLWIPVIWLWIVGSRPVSAWLHAGPTMEDVSQYLDGSPLDRFVFLVLLVAGLAVLTRRGSEVVKVLQSNLPIVLFFVYCLLSVIWSDFPFVAFKRWTKAIGDFVMILIVITDPDQSAAIKAVLKRTTFILIPWSVLFVKYYPDWARTYNVWNWEVAYTGVTSNKNTLGMICLVFGMGSLWRFLSIFRDKTDPHRIQRLIAYGSVLVMVLWLLQLSNSMTSLACFLLVSTVLVASNFRTLIRTPVLVHVLVFLVIGIAIFAIFLDQGGTLIKGVGRDPTLTGRTAIWKTVLFFSGSPFVGCGFESFWLGDRLERVWSQVIDRSITEAHNGYLEVYLNLGWIGIALLCLLIATGYHNAMAMFRRDPDAGRMRLAYLIIALLYSLTEAGFRMMAPVWIFFLFAVTNTKSPAIEETPPPPIMNRAKNLSRRNSEIGELLGARSRKGAI